MTLDDYDKGGLLPGGPTRVRLDPGESILTPEQIRMLVEAWPDLQDGDD